MLISRVRKIHSRSLQVEHSKYDTTYDELPTKWSFSPSRTPAFLHYWSLKPANTLSPQYLWGYFTMNFLPYDLRKGNTLQLRLVHSTCHGINSALFRGSLLWNNLPMKTLRKASLLKNLCKYWSNTEPFRVHV